MRANSLGEIYGYDFGEQFSVKQATKQAGPCSKMYRKYLESLEDQRKRNSMGNCASVDNSTNPKNSTVVPNNNPSSVKDEPTTSEENIKSVPPAPALPKLSDKNAKSAANPTNKGDTKSQIPLSAEDQAKKDEWKEKNRKDLESLKNQADDLERMIKESMAMLIDPIKKDPVYQGNVSVEMSSPAKIIRIFTSSTFTDTMYERNRMMETTYPHLRSYCQKKGFEFQIVDMRWGIRDEATNDHMTTEICLQEIANCQKYSAGPNFLSLLSHKYGYRTLPRQVLADKFEEIIKNVESEDNQKLLMKWYCKDENYVPPKYILQPISTHLPDFVTKDNKEKQTTAKKQWWAESDLMFDALVKAAEKVLPQEEAYKFKLSVTHTEIMSGMLKSDQDIKEKCVWVRRNIKDIDKQEPTHQLSRFTECTGPEDKVKVVKQLMEDLKRDMTKTLPEENILTYDVTWQEKGLDPNFKEHSDYLEKICDDSEKKLKELVDGIIEKDKKKKPHPLKEEAKQHILFCQTKLADFKGKEQMLQMLEALIKVTQRPIVIHGESGSGKTSLMAMIAKKCYEMYDGKATVIIRFLGTTPKSSNLLDLLNDLTDHIRFAKVMTPVRNRPQKIQDTKLLFRHTVNSVKEPLVLILDSLDQLDDTFNAKDMDWLPLIMNTNVKIIVSTLGDPKYQVLQNLKSKLSADCFIPVNQISRNDVTMILSHWFTRKERTLTNAQEDLILTAYDQCPLPLYLNLCFQEASQWPSYLDVSNIHLFKSIKEAINGLFTKMETQHGKIFVSRTFGYLTAAKIGLTETELEDLLACDDEVLNDVYVYWTPPIRRLPPLLLARLRHDLQQYLVERGADDSTVIYWYHRQFIEVARERYCAEGTSLKSLHSAIADYFIGKWADGKKKPYVNRNGESGSADRLVMSQPLQFGDVYNKRKLSNLPYHLTKAGRIDELKQECLMNPEFLVARLKSSSLRALIDDLKIAVEATEDHQLDYVLQALHLSEDALLNGPDQLIPQLLARLEGQKEMQSFLDTLKKQNSVYLWPDHNFLVKVGGPLIYALGGHSSSVDWVDLQKDGRVAVTAASDDNTLGLWDIKEGHLIRMLEKIADYPNEVYFVCDDSLILIYDSSKLILVTELGVTKYKIPHKAITCFAICGEKKEILVAFLSTGTIQLLDISTGQKIDEIKPMEGFDAKEKKSKKFGCFCSGGKTHAIVTTNDDKHIWVVDIVQKQAYCSKRIVFPTTEATKDEEEEDITVDAIIVSPDGKYVVLSNVYDNIPYLFDIKTFDIIRSLQGDDEGALTSYLLSPDGKTLYAEVRNDVVTIDIESGKRKTVVSHNASISCVKSVDMKIFLTVSTDSILRVWDSSRTISETKQDNEIGLSTSKMFEKFPLERYMLAIGSVKKREDKQIVIYDSVEHKVVSQARFDQKITIDHVEFIDDWKAVIVVSMEGPKNKNFLVLMDFETMNVTPIPGNMYRDCRSVVKVNNGKEFMVPTNSGKNFKFYSIDTLKAEYIIKLPEDFGKRLSNTYIANRNGTLVTAMEDEMEQILVLDVEARKVLKVFTQNEHNIDSFSSDFFIPENKKYVIFSAMKKGAAAGGNTLFLWECETDAMTEMFDFEYGKKYKKEKSESAVDFSQGVLLDDNTLISTHDDTILRVWQCDTKGTLLKRILGHRSTMPRLYYTPTSPYIMSYGIYQEEVLFLWDKKSYELVANYKLDEPVYKAFWSDDGLSFVTTTTKNMIMVIRWTVHGVDSQVSSVFDSPASLKTTFLGDNIPTLEFKPLSPGPDDIDQEEACPESDLDDSDFDLDDDDE